MATFDRHEADRLLTRLLDLPAGERLAALDAECDDDALRSAVLRLLQAAEGPGSVIDPDEGWTDDLWEGLAREAAKRESPMSKDELIGPYRILGEIARGGMAVVYRAERVDGEFTREVAVKVLKFGTDTGDAVRRFEQERQILADLDHPNIARMFDAGRTGDGRPYLVMELVEGVPIDRYCDERRLSINDRLELFCVVTRAVESAHQNLVVHRDLKPSNILVNQAGEVKLLDFGIARLLETRTGDATAAPTTRPMLRMMTPEYASPEQVRGERVTTASDTYQLGLLLYELLTGHRPYAFSRESPSEFERVICEQPPTRPSTSVTRDALLKRPDGASETTAEEICHARRLSANRLRRRLRGDLDNIVLMALHKEPQRRYRTADQLAQDIRRYLDGAPVAARADTWAYRGRKFLERHAIGAAAAAVLLITAIGLAGLHTVRVQNERDRAQAEAAKAEQVSGFLVGLFRGVSPREARGRELTARELLDHGVIRIEHELSAQPEIKADMLHVLGQTYLEMGMYNSADELLSQALELRGEQLGAGHPETASILTDLGLLDYRRGLYTQADTLLEEAINNLKAFSTDEVAEKLANALLVKGENFSQLGKPDQALSTLQRALALQSEVSGRESPAAARIMHRIGVLYRTTGEIAFAEQHFNNAIKIYEQKFGTDYPDIGTILVDLAAVMGGQGKLESAEEAYRRGLAILEKAYGPNHGNVSIALTNLGSLLLRLNQPEEALEMLHRAYEVKVATVGTDHPGIALSLANLGGIYLDTGRLEEARDAFQQGAEVRNNTLYSAQFDAMLLHLLVGLGRTETRLGNEDAANKSLDEALVVWHRAPDTTDPRVRPALRYLGEWLIEQQRCDEAVPLLEHVIKIENLMPEPATEQIAEIEELLAGC